MLQRMGSLSKQLVASPPILPPFSPLPVKKGAVPGGLYLRLRVKPGASRSRIVSLDSDCLTLQIDAPPHDGEANAAVVDYMRQVFGLRRSDVQLVSGHKSRDKVISISYDPQGKEERLVSFYQSCFEALRQEISNQ